MAKRGTQAEESGISLVDMDPETRKEAEEMAELDRAEGGALFKAIEESKSIQGAEVILRRTMPADTAGFCDKIPVGEFDLTMLKTKYGPGTYVIRFSGIGGKFLPGGGTIKIAPLAHQEKSNGATDITSVMEMIEKQRAADRERSNRLMELAIPTLGTVLAALLGGRQQTDVAGLVAALKPAPGPSLTDLVTALSSMKTLQGESSDPVDKVFKIMEAVKQMGGGEAGESNWTDVVKELIREGLPMAKGVLENAQAHQAQLQQQPQRPPLTIQPLPPHAAVSASPGPITPPQPESVSIAPIGSDGESDMLTMFMPTIREHLAKVTKWAQDNRNPESYAEVFFDDIPPILWRYVTPADAIKGMQREDWFQKVVEFYPALETHREWCDEFRHELISLIADNLKSAEEENETGEE